MSQQDRPAGATPVTITVLDNGPYLVKGPLVVSDASGRTFTGRETIALCRCGHSNDKPFCDGSHRKADFQNSVTGTGEGAERA